MLGVDRYHQIPQRPAYLGKLRIITETSLHQAPTQGARGNRHLWDRERLL